MHNDIVGPDTETNFLPIATSSVFGEKLSQEDEALLCLQSQLYQVMYQVMRNPNYMKL